MLCQIKLVREQSQEFTLDSPLLCSTYKNFLSASCKLHRDQKVNIINEHWQPIYLDYELVTKSNQQVCDLIKSSTACSCLW
jgi:hypothetical protein